MIHPVMSGRTVHGWPRSFSRHNCHGVEILYASADRAGYDRAHKVWTDVSQDSRNVDHGPQFLFRNLQAAEYWRRRREGLPRTLSRMKGAFDRDVRVGFESPPKMFP